MDLSFITGTAPAASAAPRPPQGAGVAAPADAASFLDALAAMASLTATLDGRAAADDAEASPAEQAGAPSTDADASADGTPAFLGTVAFTSTVEARPAAAPDLTDTRAADVESDADGDVATDAWPAPAPGELSAAAGSAITMAMPASAGSSSRPPLAEAAAARPGDTLVGLAGTSTPTPDVGIQGQRSGEGGQRSAGTTPVPGASAATAVATARVDAPEASVPDEGANATGAFVNGASATTSAVLEQLRAAARTAERTETAATAPAAAPVAPRPVATDAPPAQPSSSATVATFFSQVAATSSQGQRSNADTSGDQMPGFAFGGQAGPRVPSIAPATAPAFASLVNTLQAPDTLPAETSTQIVQAIRMQVLRDGGEAHIRLDPRQFGDMTVRIRVDQGQVTARVEADTPVVREWLQNNQHLLRQNLAGQQLTLERLDVREPSSPADQGRRDESSGRDQSRNQGQPRRRRADGGELFEVVA